MLAARVGTLDTALQAPLRYNRYIVSSSAAFSPTGSPRWLRLRKAGASLAALCFFSAIIAAPIAMTNAHAFDGSEQDFQRLPAQRFTAHSSGEPLIDLGYASATEAAAADGTPSAALYSLSDFLFSGVVNWGGYKFTFYSQQVLPGGGLAIPGRHVNAAGYVSDSDGYIVLAGSAPKGTVYDTPFGYQGKIYDRGTVGNHLDVYIR